MGIETWTDKEYAEAALDMLPDNVEEVGKFLRQQGVRESKVDACDVCSTCPIAQWVNQWTDRTAYVGFSTVSTSSWNLKLPLSAQQFINKWERYHTLA